MRIKNIFLLIATIFSFSSTQAMEDGHYPWVKNDSVIKFKPQDFTDIRCLIQEAKLEEFKHKLITTTKINYKTIEFLCTNNKKITVARNEILSEQLDQIGSFLKTLENNESYNEFAAHELKKTKKDLFYKRTIGFANIFAALGISIASTYVCHKAHSYFDNPLMRLGAFVAGIISFSSIGKAVADLPENISEFKLRNKYNVEKYNNAQGIVNFFENVKKLSEQNKNEAVDKGAGQ